MRVTESKYSPRPTQHKSHLARWRLHARHLGEKRRMIRIVAGFIAMIAVTGLAQGTEMHPMQATSISLGEVSGVAYYSETPNGYEVVATLAAGENGTPMRFVTTLSAGQRMLVSVPQDAQREPIEVEFARLGDTLVVTNASPVTALTN